MKGIPLSCAALAAFALSLPAFAAGDSGGGSDPTSVTVTQWIGAHGFSDDDADATLSPGDTFTRTFTADDDYIIAALYVNGEPVPDAQFMPDHELTLHPDADTTIDVTFVKYDAWWVMPAVRNTVTAFDNTYSPIGPDLSADGRHLFVGRGPDGDCAGVAQYDAAAFLDSVDPAFAPTLRATGRHLGCTSRGIGISAEYGVALAGGLSAAVGVADGTGNLAYPIDGDWSGTASDTRYAVGNDAPSPRGPNTPLSPVKFGYRSEYAYGVEFGTTNLFQFAVQASASGVITNLSHVRTFPLPSSPIAIQTLHVGGQDLVFAGGSSNRGVSLIDPVAGTVTNLPLLNIAVEPVDIVFTGIADGTPRMMVLDRQQVQIWDLAPDFRGVVSPEPLYGYQLSELNASGADLPPYCGFAATDDDANAILTYAQSSKAKIAVLEFMPAEYVVERAFSIPVPGLAQVERGGLFFDATTNVVVTVPAGYAITAVASNGVAIASNLSDTTYTLPLEYPENHVRLDITVEAPNVTITQTVGTHGSASPSSASFTVAPGDGLSITYAADPWYRISSLTVDGVEVSAAAGQASYTLALTSLTADTSVAVSFAIPAGVGGYTAAQSEWFAANGVAENATATDSDGDGLTAEQECLLNLSATAADTIDFKVSDILIGNTVSITIGLVRSSDGSSVGRPLLGTLVLEGSATPAPGGFAPIANQTLLDAFDGTLKETFTVPASSRPFFRAVITK